MVATIAQYIFLKIPAVNHAIYSAFIKLVFKEEIFFWPMKLLSLDHDTVDLVMILKLYGFFIWVKPFT